MNRAKVFYLRIAASFLVILLTLPISFAVTDVAETNFEDENNETNFTSMYDENELMDQEIGLNFRFLTSMLQMLDLNLNLITEP